MKRMIIGISGASGVIYGIRALELLRQIGGIETHLVLSSAAARTIRAETRYSVDEVEGLADVRHAHRDIGASIASGSFRTDGMLVAPCSVKTLSAIAHCYTDDLISRAADVQLKERRRVVLMFRETPLHAGHIDLMAQATRSGAVLMPPVPAFYARQDSVAPPRDTLDDAVTQSVGRAIDLFGLDAGVVRRWQGQAE
ncbi:MAG: UbiX family flavin prenyltransferase [Planctomycetaceae bacterium]